MSTSFQKRSLTREYHLHLPKDFQRPTNLLQRVYEQQVVLENIFIRDITIYGTIRVNNCSFHKKVFLRYTIDQWKTSSTINTSYSMHYADNNTDVFLFKLTIPKEKLSSMTLSFAICYCANGEEFWDNNYSRNYTLEMIESIPKATTSIINPFSTKESIVHNQIAQDYYAIPNPSHQAGNLCGLKNLNGTCYMNSILQSLSFTSLLTNEYMKDMTMKKDSIVGNEYLNVLHLLCCGKYAVITPTPFIQIIGHIQSIYLRNQQQDAQEFLMFLLDYLHKDLNNDSIIIDLFYGTYQSTTTCMDCMCSSRSFEPFVCLNVPIPSVNQCTLEDCLTYLNEEEYLIDDSKWFCPKCHALRNAKKRLEIYKFPKILIIQLKRFQINSDMNWIKNDTLVLYPEDNLTFPQPSSSSHQPVYTLYSVINHNGSLDDGHYTTFSRDLALNSQVWFECDDETIKYLQPDQLSLNSKAYLLFYMIKSTSDPIKT